MENNGKKNKKNRNAVGKLEQTSKQPSVISASDFRDSLSVLETLFLPLGIPDGEKKARIAAAHKNMRGIAPTDSLERMLAVQMVSVHYAAMECLRRASLEGQTKEARESNLNQTAKLSGVFTRQMEALDKHRGKGQQKVTVEHVHVESGGQAVVGLVHTQERILEPQTVNVDPPDFTSPPRQREPLRSRRVRSDNDSSKA